MSFIFRWLIGSVILYFAGYLVSTYLHQAVSITIEGALIGAAVLTLANILIKPVLNIITLPINIITLGLFSLVVNAAIVWYAAQFVPGFSVANFLTAFVFALVLSIFDLFFGTKL